MVDRRKNQKGAGDDRRGTQTELRLQKIIAQAGVTSRRHAEEIILAGRVTVNGKIVRTLGSKADPKRDHIKVDGKRLTLSQSKVYLLMNKPRGVITSLRDPKGRPTVLDLLSGFRIRVYPVGRLDFDTEGVLLLTNDGELAEKLMHPRSEVKKTYLAKIRGELRPEEISKIRKGGLSIPGGKTAPASVRTIEKIGKNSWVEMTLHEGKKRQVREMLFRLGHPVSKLKRIRYAFLGTGDLTPGQWRHLDPKEVELLNRIVYKRAHHAGAIDPHEQRRDS